MKQGNTVSLDPASWDLFLKSKKDHQNIIAHMGIYNDPQKYKELATLFKDNNYNESGSGLTYCIEITLASTLESIGKVKASSVPWAIGILKTNNKKANWTRSFNDFSEGINALA